MRHKHFFIPTLFIVVMLFAAGSAWSCSKTPNRPAPCDDSVAEAPAVAANDLGEPQKLHVLAVEYDFSLANQGNNTYQPTNMLDENPATAWAVNLDKASYDCDKLYGPVFTFDGVKLSHIVIHNGYGKNEASFKNNTRAAKIIFNNAEAIEEDADTPYEDLYNGPLKDINGPQVIRIDPNLKSNSHIRSLFMIFYPQGKGNYYKGAKWNDLCISEVEFWGWEDQ